MRSAENTARSIGSDDEIRLPKLSHIVAERLRAQIVSGQLKVGDRLPPEAELLEIYKVSRPTLRESLRILESESLISVSRGIRSGATVLGPNVERAAEYASVILACTGTTFADVHDARMFLEPSIVRSLAQLKDPKTIKSLRTCVEEMEEAMNLSDYTTAATHVNDFHELLVRFSGNQTLILLVAMLRVILGGVFSGIVIGNSEDNARAVRKNMEKTIACYTTLVDMISAGKADEAESFWRRYMERGHEFLTRTGIGKKRIAYRGNPANGS